MDDHTFKGWERLLLLILVFAIGLGLLPAALTRTWPSSPNEFGDMFGFANAMISAMAFAALFLALRMQSEELKLQRQELQDTRAELKRSAGAQEEAARLGTLSTYLSVVSTAIDYHIAVATGELPSNPNDPDDGSPDDCYESRMKAERLVEEIESLRHVLDNEARKCVPEGLSEEVMDDVRNRLDGILAVDGKSLPLSGDASVLSQGVRMLARHLRWKEQTIPVREARKVVDQLSSMVSTLGSHLRTHESESHKAHLFTERNNSQEWIESAKSKAEDAAQCSRELMDRLRPVFIEFCDKGPAALRSRNGATR